MNNIEIKVFLKSNNTELKNVIGINFEKKVILVKNYFKNGKRLKVNGFYFFDSVYFKIFYGDKTLTINEITTKEQV